MKIRTDFVTNSSSSSFTVMSVESGTLENILQKYGHTVTQFSEFDAEADIGDYACISPDVTETIISILCAMLGYEDEEIPSDADDYKMIHEILENKTTINAEANVDISRFTSGWDGGFDLSYSHLLVKEGIGDHYEIEISDFDFEEEETYSQYCDENGFDYLDFPVEHMEKNFELTVHTKVNGKSNE